MKFWLLTHKLGSWNFSVNPLISSLERDVLFWWERGGCHVRAKREENKNKEKGEEKEGRTFCLVQPRRWDKERTFGAAKSDKGCGQLGWDTCIAREKYHTHLFQLLEIIHFTPYQLIILERPKNNITFHTYKSLT